MEEIVIHDKRFSLSIEADKISKIVGSLANKMSLELQGNQIVFVVILNGAFMFASDLLKRINLNCTISFVKLASYEGTTSRADVLQLIGLNEELKNKTVVIIEDIIDSGRTLDNIMKRIKALDPAEIKVASLFHKPDAYRYNYAIDYVGFNVPNEFIVGYGLDYKGLGRNLTAVYAEVLPI